MAARRKKKMPDQPATEPGPKVGGARERTRTQAAAAKISPAVPPAGAALLADVDPALDTESETQASARRATGRDRMTGEE